jgi:hypothetical protein
MFQYEGKAADSLGSAGVRVSGAVWVVLLVAESALAVLFLYDIFTAHAAFRLEARAHSKVEILALACQTIATFSHFYLHEQAHVFHYIICLLSSAVTSAAYIYFLPFYNLFTTFVNALAYAVFAWSSFALILGDLLTNATCGFLLTLLVPIVMAMLLWNVLERRCEYVKSTYIQDFIHLRTVYQCELCIRFAAMDFKSTGPTQSAWIQYYKESQYELFNRMTAHFEDSMYSGIWEFAFIFGTLKDESLARIKLSKTKNCSFDLECVFNQYRFVRLLARRTEKANEEVEYVNFRLLYDKAKKADEESCYLQLDFWMELGAEKPIVNKVETLARRVNLSIARAKELFSKLVQLFPKSYLALELYGSYLTDVLNDTEKGRELTVRGLFEKNEMDSKSLMMESHFSYFDDTNGIMLLSGDAESVGSIVYINTVASVILGTTSHLALGMNIASFLPETLVNLQAHNSAMRRFLLFSTSNDVGLPFNLFLLDISGFLVEIHLQVKCMSLDLRQFFLVALKKINAPREMCIFDKELLVKSHTRMFPYLVGYSDQMVLYANMQMDQMVNDFHRLRAANPLNNIFEYTIPGTINTLAMRFAELVFRGKHMQLLYCTQDREEKDKWLSDEEKDAAMNFAELLHSDKQLPAVSVVIPVEPAEHSNSLKSCLKRTQEKKDLNVKFDLEPVFFELPETDFKAGTHKTGKLKDAAPLDPKQSKSISFSKEEEAKESTDEKIYDLKDICDFEIQGADGDMDADVQSKVSLALISELSQGIDPNRKGAKSVASSAVSSNSSFTSSATAVQLLKIVQSSMTRFKCSFLFTNLVVICSVLGMVIYLAVASAKYEDTLVIEELSIQRSACSVLATIARDIILINSKELPADDLQDYMTLMDANLQKFNKILDLLMNKVEDFASNQYQSLFLEDKVPTWELSAGVTLYSQASLLNILRKMSTYATSVIASQPSELNATHPGLFYLTRNGQGETLRMLNQSVWYFISGEQEQFSSTLTIIGGLGILALLLMMACFVIVMLPTVFQVDRSNQNVWTFFYRLPLDIIQDLKFRREERIDRVHGTELDQRQGETTHFKSMKSRILIQCSRKWPYVFSRIWIYYLITVGYAIYFYFDVYLDLAKQMQSKPERLNLLGERDLEVVTAYYWLQETLLTASSVSLAAIHSGSQAAASPFLELENAISHLNTLQDELAVSKDRGLGMEANSTSFSFNSACSLDDTSCFSTVLVRGLHSALRGYSQDLAYISHSPMVPASPEVVRLRSTATRLHQLSSEMVESANSEMSADIQAVRLRVELVTAAYCIVCILFYLLVYLPMASLVRKQLTDIWDLAELIPIDLLERIKRALRVSDPPK